MPFLSDNKGMSSVAESRRVTAKAKRGSVPDGAANSEEVAEMLSVGLPKGALESLRKLFYGFDYPVWLETEDGVHVLLSEVRSAEGAGLAHPSAACLETASAGAVVAPACVSVATFPLG